MFDPIQKNRNTKQPFQSNIAKIDLPTEDLCQVYPRVSTQEQMENVSAEMQQDKSFALSCGWTEDRIIVDNRDLGVSGQVRMEDRKAFNEMLRRIAMDSHEPIPGFPEENFGELTQRKIKAVVVTNVDRLFRNKWGDESGKFMEICFRYGVIVVTPDFVYDFRISWHIDRFKRRCEEAWNYLEYHVYGRLHPAQDERGFAGFWAGGHFPLGYIVDAQEKIDGVRNPNHYKYIPYRPHAEIIAWIFRRFKQLNGNVRALIREIETKQLLFPDFDDTVPLSLYGVFSHYSKVPGGYTITSDTGLRKILKNRVYIGYWIYKGELVSTNNHEPIVNLDDFTYAYNRLSSIKLDGTPNEEAVEGRGKQYIKRHKAERPAILKECLIATDPKFKIYARERIRKARVDMYYGFFAQGVGKVRANPSYQISAEEFDSLVLARLRERMGTSQAASDFHNFTTVESEVVKEASETLRDIERDIAATKALMARTKEQIKAGKFTDPDLADAANVSYVYAKAELQRLEERKKQTSVIAQEDNERRTYKTLMHDVEDAWKEIVLPEDHPRLAYLFIKSVTLEVIAPLFFSATIVWRDPAWETDSGLFYKGAWKHARWTKAEIATLLEHYATTTRKELMELLPRRSFSTMKDYILAHSSIRRVVSREPGVPRAVCLEDWKIMQEHGISEEMIRRWENVKLITWDFDQWLFCLHPARSHHRETRSCIC
jgi:hypothetical protein